MVVSVLTTQLFSLDNANALTYTIDHSVILDWGLNPGPPALEASTIPLGYRGGGSVIIYSHC